MTRKKRWRLWLIKCVKSTLRSAIKKANSVILTQKVFVKHCEIWDKNTKPAHCTHPVRYGQHPFTQISIYLDRYVDIRSCANKTLKHCWLIETQVQTNDHITYVDISMRQAYVKEANPSPPPQKKPPKNNNNNPVCNIHVYISVHWEQFS